MTVIAFRAATLDERRSIARAAEHAFGTMTGIVPDILFFVGILCFIGFLFCLLLDYRHSRRKTWLP